MHAFDMDKPIVLPGHVIVAKGITKLNASLPEVGLKDTVPNGSWIEQKQIQTGLEARKHLLEVERIEKLGVVSHAIWCDDLQLAEVTQKVGGYWQYLGHNIGKTLYLRPEEVLFLMEINCLLLKHNGVTVSLQKAHNLLLDETISLKQYKVYASLSRLGYRVYRHKLSKVKEGEKETLNCRKINQTGISESLNKQLLDRTVVENVAEPATDSSAEILDKHLPITELNTSEEKNNIEQDDYKTIEENESEINKQLNNRNNIKEPTCIMEVDENELHNNNIPKSSQPHQITDSESLTTNANDVVTKNAVNTSQVELVKSENNKIEEIGLKNSECDEVMQNSVALTQCTAGNTLAIKETAISEEKTKKIKNTDTPEIETCMENNNMDITETVHIDDQNKPDVMDISDECCQAVAASTVLSNERDDNKNLHTLAIDVDSADSDIVLDLDTPKEQELTTDDTKTDLVNTRIRSTSMSDVHTKKRNQMFQNYVTKLKRLTSREYKSTDFKTLAKHFEIVPDLFRKDVITINAPDQQYIPKHIFVNKCSYVLNIKDIVRKSTRSISEDSAAYNSSDEGNDNRVMRIGNVSIPQNIPFENNLRFPPRPNLFYRPYTFWRPRNNYVQFNMFFQRPCFSNMYLHQRFQYQPRPVPLFTAVPDNVNLNSNNSNANNPTTTRKRTRGAKATHFASIKSLAVRLKQLIMEGNHHIQNIESLHRLLYAYNTRYKTRLRLTKNFEVTNDETIVETIDLEDEDEIKNKRPRLSQDADTYNENLNLLRQLALKLKDLDAEHKASSKHKRALSKAIKTFNKSYDADIYMNANFEVIDKRFIHIDSDSESDCVVEEPENIYKSKKVRNPFNILKRRSEKQRAPNASTSKENDSEDHGTNSVVFTENNPSTSKKDKNQESGMNNIFFAEDTINSQPISSVFKENWLPQENDFGKPEVVHKNIINSRFIDAIKEEYMLNFIKNHIEDFNNWLEAKVAFLQHMEETDVEFENEKDEQLVTVRESITGSGIKPLIGPEDCLDNDSVAEKLRIIKNNKEVDTETTLSVDFDVFHRDVGNFRKSNPPKPHFRIICIAESSTFPSSADIMSLHSKYNDNIPIVFAIVGISSISYLQINPTDLPVYTATNDLD